MSYSVLYTPNRSLVLTGSLEDAIGYASRCNTRDGSNHYRVLPTEDLEIQSAVRPSKPSTPS